MKKNNLIYGIILIVLGVLLMIFKGSIIRILLSVAGVLLAGIGILDIINKDYQFGIGKIVIGILLIVFGNFLIEVCLIALGVLLIVYAVDLIVRNVEYLKSLTMANKLKQLLMPIVIIIIGVLFIVSRWKLVDVVFIIHYRLYTAFAYCLVAGKMYYFCDEVLSENSVESFSVAAVILIESEISACDFLDCLDSLRL